jgi:hypothetical protein
MILRIKLLASTARELYGDGVMTMAMIDSADIQECIITVNVSDSKEDKDGTYWYLQELRLGKESIRMIQPYIFLSKGGDLGLWATYPGRKPNVEIPIAWVVRGEFPDIPNVMKNYVGRV